MKSRQQTCARLPQLAHLYQRKQLKSAIFGKDLLCTCSVEMEKNSQGHHSDLSRTPDEATVDHRVCVLPCTLRWHSEAELGLESRFPVPRSGCHFNSFPHTPKENPIYNSRATRDLKELTFPPGSQD